MIKSIEKENVVKQLSKNSTWDVWYTKNLLLAKLLTTINHTNKLNTHKKRFNVRANICQSKRDFYIEMLILLKLSLSHAHLRSGAMIVWWLCMYITYNVSIISQYISILFNFSKLYYYNLFN